MCDCLKAFKDLWAAQREPPCLGLSLFFFPASPLSCNYSTRGESLKNGGRGQWAQSLMSNRPGPGVEQQGGLLVGHKGMQFSTHLWVWSSSSPLRFCPALHLFHALPWSKTSLLPLSDMIDKHRGHGDCLPPRSIPTSALFPPNGLLILF